MQTITCSHSATANEKEKSYTGWSEKYFSKSAPQFYYAIPGKLKNDLLVTGNGLLEYCNKNTYSSRLCGYSSIEEATDFEQEHIKPGQ